MPAYRPPPQVLFQPVTNYYQGKAIRTQQAMAEKELETYDQKLALDERRVASQEQNAQTNEDMLAQRQTEFKQEVGETNYKRLTLHAKSVVDTIDQDFGNTQKTPEDQLAVLQKNIPLFEDYLAAVAKVSPERAAAAQEALADGVLTPEEYQGFRDIVNNAYSEFTQISDPTAKMKEARSMGYVPGTAEYEEYLKGSGRAPSLSSLAVPIYEKMLADPDYQPTDAEQTVLSDYRRLSPLERLLAQQQEQLLKEQLGDDEPDEQSGEPEPPQKIDILEVLAATISQNPDVDIDRFLSIAKETYGVEIPKEEAERFVAMFPYETSSFGDNANRGTINRPD